jgi:Leucine-rich repeat (LRR) protein
VGAFLLAGLAGWYATRAVRGRRAGSAAQAPPLQPSLEGGAWRLSAGIFHAKRVTPELLDGMATKSPEARFLELDHPQADDVATLRLARGVPHVSVREAIGPVDLSPIADLPDLRILEIVGTQVASLEPIARSGVSSLSLDRVQGADDLAPLARAANLTQLSVRGPSASTVEALAGAASLQTLSFGGSSLSSLAGMGSLPHLEELIVADSPATDLGGLADLTALRSLTLRGMKLTTAPRLPRGLRSLELTDFRTLDAAFVAAAPHLESLRLPGADLVDVRPIGALKDLERLDLTRNHKLKDIAPLASLVHLKELTLSDTDVESLAPLAKLPLVSIELHGTRATSLAPLASIPTLRNVTRLPQGYPEAETDALEKANPSVKIERVSR